VTENDLLKTVIDMARLFGLTVAHFRAAQAKSGNWVTPVQGDGKGYPDLTIVGPGGVLWRELKSARGALSPEQVVWLKTLNRAAGEGSAAVWKPEDLHSGRIEAELRALRTRVAI